MLDDSNYFYISREARGNVGDKMKEVGNTLWVVIIIVLLTVVVLQLFREGIATTMVLTSREGAGRWWSSTQDRNQRQVLVCEF
jgi:hypothetical protein